MDSKKSPLALLAQTCSQIGSDPPSSSTPSGTVPAGGSSSSSGSSATTTSASGAHKSAPERKKSVDSNRDKTSPISGSQVAPPSAPAGMDLSSKPSSRNESSESCPSGSGSKSTKANSKESRLTPTTTAAETRRSKSSSPKSHPASVSAPSQQAPSALAPSISAYPLMMPTADPMAGYKSLMAAGMASPYSAAASFSPYGYPGAMGLAGYPGLDLNAYASALKAMPPPPPSLGGYLGLPGGGPGASSYSSALAVQFSRMNAAAAAASSLKPPTSSSSVGSEPCRDPYCTGCSSGGAAAASSPAIHMICAAGCGLAAQCDHPKVPVPSVSGAAAATAPQPKPYVCNWIVGDNYCGKRFASSDDLLSHLRTHTNLSSPAGGAEQTSPPSILSAAASLRAAYPTPPLSPLSAARYHPYGKHQSSAGGAIPAGGAPPSMPMPFHPGSAYPSALFHHPALAPYYSHHPHLSLFAPRASLPP